MKVLTGEQMKMADAATIKRQHITSLELMERAASKCTEWILQNTKYQTFNIFSGPGNNGGDGLAIARMLLEAGKKVKVILLNPFNRMSDDCKEERSKLLSIDKQCVTEINSVWNPSIIPSSEVNIDAIFGIGLTRPAEAIFGSAIDFMNDSGKPTIAIDIPSGIYSDKVSLNTGNKTVKASITLTFGTLKRALLVGENAPWYGLVQVLNIGLDQEFLDSAESKTEVTDEQLLTRIFIPKQEFSHKGTFGHGLLITGQTGQMGASVLMARGYLKGGGGLLTLMIPKSERQILQSSVPEAMNIFLEDQLPDLERYAAIGVGPGLGTGSGRKELMRELLSRFKGKLILDADALNLLSDESDLMKMVAPGSLLTPHPGEFRRLAGVWKNDFHKLDMQLAFAKKYKVILVLKGKNTSIATPNGQLYFNPTGNAGMAKGGSGDILAGLLTSMVASGYDSLNAAILGTWIHGMAGDLAAAKLTPEAMNGTDIIDQIPAAWKLLNRITGNSTSKR